MSTIGWRRADKDSPWLPVAGETVGDDLCILDADPHDDPLVVPNFTCIQGSCGGECEARTEVVTRDADGNPLHIIQHCDCTE